MPRPVATAPTPQHAVAFLDREPDVVAAVVAFVADGLAAGDGVLLVSPIATTDPVEEALRRRGEDVDGLRREGRLRMLDAESTLTRLLVDGRPEPLRLRALLEEVLGPWRAEGRRTRVVGDMAALLWSRGDIGPALELESAWEDLVGELDVRLLCPYPMSAVQVASLSEVRDVCALHSKVVAPASYAAPGALFPVTGTARVFLPVPEAVVAVRRLVTGVLSGQVSDRLLEDAALVASEMAANAVTHAESPFRVVVEPREAGARVRVEDLGAGVAERRTAGDLEPRGRGLAIVGTLAERWGCDSQADGGGKVVWAQLSEPQPLTAAALT